MTTTYRAAVIGLGRMGSTFDDERTTGGAIYLPYCHTPAYVAAPQTELVAGGRPARRTAVHLRRALGARGPRLRRSPRDA